MMRKKFAKMQIDKRAEMGVGTMIIFIAMVLVAAVAASVLISTANTVREQAQSTGDQAINNVASGFIVHDVVGTVDNGHTQVDEITIYLRLAAGSPRINMANVMVTLVSGSVNQVMSMYASADDTVTETAWKALGAGYTPATNYFADPIQRADGTIPWASANYVVAQGDLIALHVVVTGGTIGFSQAGVIKIMPAYGQMCLIDFVTPESYSTGFVTLA